MNPYLPQARQDRLVIQPLGDELLLYDTSRDRAHVLNGTAAMVWRLADGHRTVEQIARRVAHETHGVPNTDLVWLALSQLARAGLIETQDPVLPATAKFTRREFLRQAALAAVVVPVVKTISVPSTQSAVSCVPAGGSCTVSGECCNAYSCSDNICTCFVAGTQVWYADGSLRPIEQVRVGDQVLARDEKTGMAAPQRVDKTFIHHDRTAFTLDFGTSALTTTATHPFYTDKGWVKAIDLRPGMDCYLKDGGRLKLERLDHPLPHPETVYNLQVAGYHTYFVGTEGVWVHNRTTIEDIPTS